MKRELLWMIALLGAIGLGYGLARSSGSDAPYRAVSERPDVPDARPAGLDSGIARGPESADGPASAPGGSAEDARTLWETRVGRAPTDAEWRRIVEEAARDRARLLDAAARAEVSAAHRQAELWLEEQRRLEDAARGGTMALLKGLADKAAHLPGLVADPKAFGRHFERKTNGPRLDGTALQADESVADGTTLEFPAGVYGLNTRRLFHSGRPFPKDLLIVGLGMDRTLLRIQEISTNDEVASLTFRDLTLDCNNDYMTDLRSANPATIRLERCRIVAFDMGAGGSVMFAANSGAFYATDCRFEAGYSRARAGFGNLFRVGSGLLVRMENCVFLGPFRSLYDSGSGATHHFADCEIQDTQSQVDRWQKHAGDGVRFENCRFVPIEGDGRDIERSFADINPDWPARKN